MRIIFVNRFFYPDHSATSQMLSDLAFGLAADGRQITVVTSRSTYQGTGERLAARQSVDGVEIHRVWSSRFGRVNLVGRSIDYLSFYLTSGWEVLRLARRGDIIVAKTDPPMLSILMYPIAAFRGAKLVNWMQDVFPEVATALGLGRSTISGFAISVLRRLRNWSLRRSHMNVALGVRMAEHLVRLGVDPGRIGVIPNWADGTNIVPVPREASYLRREWGLGDDFVVMHSGNLGRAHDDVTILDAIIRLERVAQPGAGSGGFEPNDCRSRPVTWVFVGSGANYERLRRDVAARGLRSVLFKPYQPRERLSESLSLADAHLVSLRPEAEGLIVPSKVYGCLAVARPILFVGDEDGEVARLVTRHECGVAIAIGDGEKLARAVAHLSQDGDGAARMGRNGRRALEAEFDSRHGLARWRTLLDQIISGQTDRE